MLTNANLDLLEDFTDHVCDEWSESLRDLYICYKYGTCYSDKLNQVIEEELLEAVRIIKQDYKRVERIETRSIPVTEWRHKDD